MKWHGYLLIIFLGASVTLKGQDAHFSQYYASGLYLNPSMAGIEPGLTFGGNYRNQWRSIVVPYVTNQVTLIAPIYTGKGRKNLHLGGIGGSIYNDKAGDGMFNTLGVNISAAYNLNLTSQHIITLGVQGGFIQKSVRFGELQWGEQFNPYVGFDASIPASESVFNSQKMYADIGTGFIYSYQGKKERSFNLYAGGSVYHLNRPNESFVKGLASRLPMLYKFHGGVEIPTGQKWSFSPNVLGMIQNNTYHFNTGLYLTYTLNSEKSLVKPSELIFGSWYRLQDSFIFLIGMGNKNYLFGFSYDFNSSSLRYNTNGKGAFEISLSIRKIKERATVKRFHTPRI